MNTNPIGGQYGAEYEMAYDAAVKVLVEKGRIVGDNWRFRFERLRCLHR